MLIMLTYWKKPVKERGQWKRDMQAPQITNGLVPSALGK